jgi:hypothetical protein
MPNPDGSLTDAELEARRPSDALVHKIHGDRIRHKVAGDPTTGPLLVDPTEARTDGSVTCPAATSKDSSQGKQETGPRVVM